MRTPVSIESQHTRLSPRFWKIFPVRAFLPLLAVFAAMFFSTGAAQGQETNRYTKVANQLMDLINAGDYAGIQAKFNKEMGAALPLDKSSAFFSRLTQQVGKIQKLGEPQPVGEWMVFPAKSEKSTFDMQLALDGRGLIAGLVFKPHCGGKTRPGKAPGAVGSLHESGQPAQGVDQRGRLRRHPGQIQQGDGRGVAAGQIERVLKGLTQQMGKIQKLGKPQAVGEAMVFPAEFEKGTLDMQIALDSRRPIAGLSFTPHTPAQPRAEKQ